jgi:hypothetical protein
MAKNKNPGIEKSLDKNKFYPALTPKKIGIAPLFFCFVV